MRHPPTLIREPPVHTQHVKPTSHPLHNHLDSPAVEESVQHPPPQQIRLEEPGSPEALEGGLDLLVEVAQAAQIRAEEGQDPDVVQSPAQRLGPPTGPVKRAGGMPYVCFRILEMVVLVAGEFPWPRPFVIGQPWLKRIL